MKKNILTFLAVIIASAAYAVSTCETRVDSHPNAATRQRVEYCLTQEEPSSVAPVSGPELVYSSTYSKETKEETETKPTVKNGYFAEDKVSVRHQYVGSRKFPAFTNDTLSEQERAALEQTYLAELEQQRNATDLEDVKKATTQRAPARLTEPVQEEDLSAHLTSEQQARGIQARQAKPKRTMKLQQETQEVVVTETPAQANAKPAAGASEDLLLSNNSYNDEDSLQDELGLDDEPLLAPIPQTINQK